MSSESTDPRQEVTIEDALENLGPLRNELVDIAHRIMSAYGGTVYMTDLLTAGALHRGLSLLRGFITLVRERNFIAAAPLIRLQLDNSIRLYAISQVDDPNDVIKRILDGDRLDRVKGHDGKKLRDAHLVEKLSGIRNWIGDLYTASCSYVHLSRQHIRHSWRFEDGEMVVSGEDFTETDLDYLNICGAFWKATDLLIQLSNTWLHIKSHPEDPRYNRWARKANADRQDLTGELS